MKLSLVIPVYNEAAYLAACLDSIAQQTILPDEVIVVDNNSSDNTAAIAGRYPFVRVITEPRQGIVWARNAGFEAAQGDIIGRIDADSRLPAGWVQTVKQIFTDNQLLAALTGPGTFYDIKGGHFAGWLQVLFYQWLQSPAMGGYCLWGSNMALRKTSWQAVRTACSTRIDIDEDIDLSLNLQAQDLKIGYQAGLRVSTSLLRGRHSPWQLARYLSTWPRDYLVHHKWLGAGYVGLLSGILFILSVPLSALSFMLRQPAALET